MLHEATSICAVILFCVAVYLASGNMYKILLWIKYYYLGFIYTVHDKRYAKYNRIELQSLPNKIAIVTGGSRGIGAEVVKMLLQCDMEVIIACRRTDAGKKLVHEIEKSGIATGRAKVYELDNASLKSVTQFVEQIKKDYDKIHMLINNAGLMFPDVHEETEDGFEVQWAVNYLSHFLLSSLLLPLLETAGRPDDCSRIINVTSCLHDICSLNMDLMCNNSKKDIAPIFYARSKLAQTIFTIKLQKLLKAKSMMVQTYCVHPGIVRTDLFKNTILGKYKWLMTVTKTPKEGARSIVYAAMNKNIDDKGDIFISNCKEFPIPVHAQVEEMQNKLFDFSLKQVQLRDFFQYL